MNPMTRQLALLSAAVAGDRAALLKLLSRSRRELCARLAPRIPASCRGALDAEDVVQDAHVEVFRRIREFEVRDAEGFDRWVATIALRKLQDALRRRRAAKRGAGRADLHAAPGNGQRSMVALLELVAGSGKTPSRVVAGKEAIGRLERALSGLSPPQREIVGWVHLEGRSMAWVAERLERSEGAVRVALFKARRRLRELLGDPAEFLSGSV